MRFLTGVFGRWNWQRPAWVAAAGRRIANALLYISADARRIGAGLLVSAGLASAWVWYATRPTPHYVTYTVTPPPLTEYNWNDTPIIQPATFEFSESAAALEEIDKPVIAGIALSPAMPGEWRWGGDK